MADFKQFDPLDIQMSWNGVPITGFAEGTFVTVERTEDSYSAQVGSGGDVVRVKSNNKMGTVTITLLQSSPANDLLSAKLILDERLGTASQVGAFFLRDLNGTTTISATDAWIQKPANVEYSNEATSREWVIACATLEMLIGGHLV